MTIEAKIICDSVGPNQIRLTTFLLSYPRFIHSEFMTHRMFSRNASSSRAIPFEKQVQMIKDDMAMPIEFRKNQKGMQAGGAIENQDLAKATWIEAGHEALAYAEELNTLGIHKQYVNRLIEPYSHITVVCTATEYNNFFALRHHHMAQPELAELAKQMWERYSSNSPKVLEVGEYHLPFVTDEDKFDNYDAETDQVNWTKLIKMSVARCARVSYNNHDGTNSTYEQDCALYDRLLGSQPMHSSPAEHQARARESDTFSASEDEWSGNFRGWQQFRQTLPNQNITTFEGPLN